MDTFVEAVVEAPPTDPCPQYSPSISHDEVECEGVGGEGGGGEGDSSVASVETEGAVMVKVADEGSLSVGKGGGDGDEMWAGIDAEERGDDWGERWSDIDDTAFVGGTEKHEQTVSTPQPTAVQSAAEKLPPSIYSSSSSSKLVLKTHRSTPQGDMGQSSSGRLEDEEQTKAMALAGKEEREEEEEDLFADMAPKITSSSSLQALLGSKEPLGGHGNAGDKATPTNLSNSLQYQPEPQVEVFL